MGGGDFAGEHLGDAKVPHLDNRPLLIEHDVLSLEVAVKDVQRVDVFNGHHQLDKELEDMLREKEGGGVGVCFFKK